MPTVTTPVNRGVSGPMVYSMTGEKSGRGWDIRTWCSILIVFFVIGGRGRLFSPGAGAVVRILRENYKRRRTQAKLYFPAGLEHRSSLTAFATPALLV
jgi:ABC-type branched-subunit amino acid transport system permease subunit